MSRQARGKKQQVNTHVTYAKFAIKLPVRKLARHKRIVHDGERVLAVQNAQEIIFSEHALKNPHE